MSQVDYSCRQEDMYAHTWKGPSMPLSRNDSLTAPEMPVNAGLKPGSCCVHIKDPFIT